jgi:hypothetical protein
MLARDSIEARPHDKIITSTPLAQQQAGVWASTNSPFLRAHIVPSTHQRMHLIPNNNT